MTATYYVLSVGLYEPQSFRWGRTTPLLTMGDLWEARRSVPPCLLMRVRSDAGPNEEMTTADELESIVGIVDPTVRWRASLAMARAALIGLRNPALSDACWKAMAVINQHPAQTVMMQRQAAVMAVREAMESLPQGQPGAMFEAAIAHGLCQFVMADNDYEAAAATPFEAMHMMNIDARDQVQVGRRSATLEALSGSVVLGAAYERLMERLPAWHFTRAPKVMPPGAEPSSPEPPRPARRPVAPARPVPASPSPEDGAADEDGPGELVVDDGAEPNYTKTTHRQRATESSG